MRSSASFPEGSYLAIGLMSGTSVDGIDAALVEFSFGPPEKLELKLLASLVHPLPEEIRAEIFSLFEDGEGSLGRLALLDLALGELFAEAALALIRKAGLSSEVIAVIGSHGQTIRHLAGAPGSPGRGSLQIGSGDRIAQRTGIPTASDFRTADIASGGTGAPLVPFFDRIAAERFEKPVVFQNFGGIGNLSWIGRSGELLAFDTGPGCMIADRLAELITGGALRFDRDGALGARGKAQEDILEAWSRHPFLALHPPKSAGREEFGQAFFRAEIAPRLEAAGKDREALLLDLLRSAELFSARCAAEAYRAFLPEPPKSLVVTGGGARNPRIMEELAARLPAAKILSEEEAGISVDFKEAEAFALMGLFRLLGLPNTEPRATGASRAVIAGKLSLP